ncbi:hypothetical protein RhiirA5_383471 [Rhizophagus irregularis]|uniref:Phosphatidylglycerol/phosphatidylinositol transfer protein n=1 Tax=Rhizophagus irregularis TaxID=588596 RepID=A0A2I1F3W7_9GLOM|nr:hypothetical protein RhiirA5_383471 [Rhizophagus irregularis]PKC68113.1 hypothetical protein RhiirA1_507881 [Rhizophagus irregularis]PKY29062.1 hypothetical protein RhiirB3_391521 [Rhizophagus irregularis]CAB4488297.1 unnamed protein product [Rhizophagus irregularis]CAB5347478.1 unnamed protein product [Rhizophagus irregularis]
MNILLFIFLFFTTFSSSTYIRRQGDALSPCVGTFPNEITTYTFTPNPIIIGQTATIHITGKATVPIENGALFNITLFHENQVFHQHSFEFCQMFVIPNGSTCPINGDYDFTINFPAESSTDDPVNTTVESDIRTQIINPDGNILSCIEGKITFHYP